MITNTSPHVSPSRNGKEHLLILRKATEVNIRRGAIFSTRRILRWLTILVTVLIVTAGIIPNAFGIPFNLRPWVFLTSIFWFLAFCAGILNP